MLVWISGMLITWAGWLVGWLGWQIYTAMPSNSKQLFKEGCRKKASTVFLVQWYSSILIMGNTQASRFIYTQANQLSSDNYTLPIHMNTILRGCSSHISIYLWRTKLRMQLCKWNETRFTYLITYLITYS